MKITADPKSDQWNADDFIGGPRTFTIAGVKVGTAEQKYDIELVEGEGRVWRPPLTMLRMLMAAWGDEAAEWTGRRVTLYRDADIKFGADKVGGIRISHLSHITKPLTMALTETRGRKAKHTVDPLPAGPAPITPKQVAEFERRIADAVTLDELDAVARDLKACDLGGHRKPLQTAWALRRGDLPAIKPAPEPEPTPEQATLADVTDEQIQDLAMAREERFGTTNTAKADWTAWVADTIGREFAGNDNALTRDEADDLLALLAAKDGAQ